MDTQINKGGEFVKSFTTNDRQRMFVIFNEDKLIDESSLLNSAAHVQQVIFHSPSVRIFLTFILN